MTRQQENRSEYYCQIPRQRENRFEEIRILLVIIDNERIDLICEERLDLKKKNEMTVMNMIDWSKIDLEEVKER